jgi:hypothetical protein
MSAADHNQEIDSLKFVQNKDGSYTAEWDPKDTKWNWLNKLTSKELKVVIDQAIRYYEKGN